MRALISSAQQIKFQSYGNNIINFNNGVSLLVMTVSSVNFTNIATEAQYQILKNYEQFLNGLETEIQILIKSTSHEDDNSQTKTLEFYLILRSQAKLELAHNLLHQQAQTIIDNLSNLNLNAKLMPAVATLNLLRSYYDDQGSQVDLSPDNLNLHTLSYQSLIHQPQYIKVNKTYYQVHEISSYPAESDSDFISQLLTDFANLSLSYYIKPIDTNLALDKLKRKITELRSRQSSQLKRVGLTNANVDDALQSALQLRAQLSRQQTKLFQLNILILTTANSLEQLKQAKLKLQTALKSKLFEINLNYYEQLSSFEACLPLSFNKFSRTYRNFNSQALALSFPFKDGQVCYDNGITYGHNHISSTLVALNRFSLVNAHALIIGQSGSGKSYLAKTEIINYLKQGVEIIVIDPENEYCQLAQAYAGKIININNLNLNFNPLSLNPQTSLSANVNYIIDLIELIIGKLNLEHQDIVDRLLSQLCLNNANPSLKDLYTLLAKEGNSWLQMRLHKFVYGSHAQLFSSRAQLNLNNKLTVINLKQINSQLKGLVMLILSHCINQTVFDVKRPRLLVIDEAWLLLQNSNNIGFLNNLIRRARKYALGLSLISQQSLDFYQSPACQALISQTSLKIIFKQDNSQIKTLKNQFGLSDYEINFLRTAKIGQALILCEDQRLPTNIVRLKSIDHLLNTNPKTSKND